MIMKTKLEKQLTLVWVALVGLTFVSWFLSEGSDQPVLFGMSSLNLGILVLTISIFKVYLIISYFMELRTAPFAFRFNFEIVLFVMWLSLIGLYSL